MQGLRAEPKPAASLARFGLLLLLFVAISVLAKADFWSLGNKGQPDTVKLVRKLPAVAARNGSTVRFQAEIAGSSIPVETATILREKIRTLLLHSKTGEIQLVDGPADTDIKCVVTSYEPKVVRPNERKVGSTVQKIETWIGNIGASVQVLDSHDHPIDAENLKNHMENDFVVSQQETKAATPAKGGSSWHGLKLPSSLSSLAVPSSVVSANQPNAGARDKGARPPTDVEWRESLIEGLAVKVANRIVPVDQEFVAVLPVEKEFEQLRELAKTGHWGNVQEQSEKMATLSGAKEADRLYMLALSYEASAYVESSKPDEATRALNKASELYMNAAKLKPEEHELFLAQLRVQDAIDHYVAIQQFLQTHGAGSTSLPVVSDVSRPASGSQATASDPNAANNANVITMTRAGLQEKIILTFIQDSKDPKFDTSPMGLIQLTTAKVPDGLIQAIQKRMASPAGAQASGQPARQPASRGNRTSNRKVAAPTAVQ